MITIIIPVVLTAASLRKRAKERLSPAISTSNSPLTDILSDINIHLSLNIFLFPLMYSSPLPFPLLSLVSMMPNNEFNYLK